MFPSVASLPADISYDCTHNDLFVCLERIINGSSLPSNVIDYVNPYKFLPSNLPCGVWFLINSNTCNTANHGLWKSKEQIFEVHSNSTIIGWKAILEYYDGEEPHQHKTNWVMEVFSITLKMTENSSKEKEASSLCKVFMNCEESVNREAQQEMPQAGLLTKDATTLQAVSKPEVDEEDNMRVLGVTARTSDLHVEGLHELVALLRDGDYLELGDLDNPVSPSSSSCNSSLLSISSDEYFDSSVFLRELEYPGTGIIQQEKSSSFNFGVSEHCKANEMAALGSSRVFENKNTKRRHKRGHEDESSRSSSSDERRGKGRGNKGSGSRMKRLRRKYFCFLPF